MNKNIFNSKLSSVPLTTVRNEAGGIAYKQTDEHALAQYCMTGTFNNTFYASGTTQLLNVLDLARKCSPEFIAKLAIYARQSGFMKDSPALLLAHLSTVNPILFKRAFPKVADNLKMVRNFVNVMRSGVVGRKSLGTAPKKMVQKYLTETPVLTLFRESIGSDPSLSDLIRMVHPRPTSNNQKNFFAYVLGNKYDEAAIEPEILIFEKFKRSPVGNPPEINFQFLSNIKMDTDQWTSIANNMSWHTLRMNLNTLERNGVFKKEHNVEKFGKVIANTEVIGKVKVFPFQIYNTIRNSTVVGMQSYLEQALTESLKNIPEFKGKTAVMVDVSGSMGAPVMGEVAYARTSAPVSCKDAAGLFAAAIKAKNPETLIIPFHTEAVPQVNINRVNETKVTVFGITKAIAECPGGGTDCSAGIRYLLNSNKFDYDNLVILSDNESWAGSSNDRSATWVNWVKYKSKNPNAKLVCVDIAPYATTQVLDGKSVINIGGFSDQIFTTIEKFTQGLDNNHWVNTINSVEL